MMVGSPNLAAQEVEQEPAPNMVPRAEAEALLTDAANYISAGTPHLALQPLDELISAYQAQYDNSDVMVFNARTTTETIFYTVIASGEEKDAVIADNHWADALFLKAYVLIEMRDLAAAKATLEKALNLSPKNSRYLSELGHIYQTEKNWTKALELFQRAEKAADTYSPDLLKSAELSRALRGQGYSLIEQGKLDEAEEIYKRCLEIDKNDRNAKHELEFIKGLKEQSR